MFRFFGSRKKRDRRDGKRAMPRYHGRRLKIEPLENRTLLTVAVTLNVSVANLPGATANVPVIAADVEVDYSLFTTPGSESGRTKTTNINGSCVVSFDDSAFLLGTTISVCVYSRYDHTHVSNPTLWSDYQMYPGVSGNVYKFTQGGLVVNAATASFDVTIDYKTDAEMADAFTNFSSISVPATFALSLGAKLPPKFYVEYPSGDEGGKFWPLGDRYKPGNDQTPTIGLQSGVLQSSIPTCIAHEFGHMVAFSNGFANAGSGEYHCYVYNLRSVVYDRKYQFWDTSAGPTDMDTAFCEGFADYFSVASIVSQTGDVLHIPALAPKLSTGAANTVVALQRGRPIFDISNAGGRGEDNEESTATMLWQLDKVGINADGKNKDEASIQPLTFKKVFQMLVACGARDLAHFYKSLEDNQAVVSPGAPSNQYLATLGALAEDVDVSPTRLRGDWIRGIPTPKCPDPIPDINGNRNMPFKVMQIVSVSGRLVQVAQSTGFATFQPSDIRVEVFDTSWQPICTCGAAPNADAGNGNPKNFQCAVTIVQNQAVAQGVHIGNGNLAITPAAWNTIAQGNGYYWVIQALSYSDRKNNATYFWGGPIICDATAKVAVTSFRGDATTNNLNLTYDILPTVAGWPNTIPAFTVNIYATPTGSFGDDRSQYLNQIASCSVTDPNYLTGTADNYEFTVQIPADTINATLLASLSSQDQYLVAEIDSNVDSSLMALARFQGGAFETIASTTPPTGTVYVYGGASLDDSTPDSGDFTNVATITSASNIVSVSGNSSDGDTTIAYSQTFTTPTGQVNAFMHDGNSTADASGISDPGTAFYAYGGAGNDYFTGGAGDDTLTAGNGNNQLIGGSGADVNISAGDGNNYVVAGPLVNSIGLGNGNNTVYLSGNNPIEGEDFVNTGNGNNIFVADAQMTSAWAIFPSSGDADNQVIVTNAAGTTVNGGPPTYFNFASGGFVQYIATATPEYALLYGGTSGDMLALDNGGTVYGLPGMSSNATVTVDNDTVVNLLGQTVRVATLNLNGGSIINGNIQASQFNISGGTIAANLADGATPATLTFSGNGYVTLTGTNTYTGGTVLGASADDTGTLDAGSVAALGNGPITFASQCTLQALGDLTLTTAQTIVTPSTTGANAVLDSNSFHIATSGIGGVGGVTVVDSSGAGGTRSVPDTLGLVEFGGTNSYAGPTEIAGGMAEFDSGALPSGAVVRIDSGAALLATGAYTTVGGWLGSGAIDPTSSGVLALVVDSSENIDMTGYPSLSLGAAADVTYSGTLTPANHCYQLGGGPGTLTVSSVLANYDSTPCAVAINGNVVLTGVNAYTNGTSLNAGTLGVAAADALGGSGGGLTFAGGVLQALAGFSTARTVHTPDDPAQTATIDANGNTLVFTGIVGGDGSLTILDSANNGGIVQLTGENTYLGGTTIVSGTLAVPSDAALRDASGNVTFNGGTLQALNGFTTYRSIFTPDDPNVSAIFDSFGNTLVLAGSISGSGGITQTDSSIGAGGTTTLEGDNSYTGPTSVTSGILNILYPKSIPDGGELDVVSEGNGQFQIQGGHTYAEAGQYATYYQKTKNDGQGYLTWAMNGA